MTNPQNITAEGETLASLFQQVAMEIIRPLTAQGTISSEKYLYVHVKSGNRNELLLDFLNELLTIIKSEHFGWNHASVEILSETEVSARLRGQKISRHIPALHEVSNVRYNGGAVEKSAEGLWWTSIILESAEE